MPYFAEVPPSHIAAAERLYIVFHIEYVDIFQLLCCKFHPGISVQFGAKWSRMFRPVFCTTCGPRLAFQLRKKPSPSRRTWRDGHVLFRCVDVVISAGAVAGYTFLSTVDHAGEYNWAAADTAEEDETLVLITAFSHCVCTWKITALFNDCSQCWTCLWV